MYLYEVSGFSDSGGRMPSADLSGPFGQSGKLQHFSPSELVLSPAETAAVLRFFWPELDMGRLGAISTSDREFAQGLLLEAVDASCTMGIAESIYKRFFLKVPTSFGSIAKSAAAIALQALRNRWFNRCHDIDPAKVKIYESIRRALALNFRSLMQIRLQTGELTY